MPNMLEVILLNVSKISSTWKLSTTHCLRAHVTVSLLVLFLLEAAFRVWQHLAGFNICHSDVQFKPLCLQNLYLIFLEINF